MALFYIKILLTVLLLVLITSCKDTSKTEQQTDTTDTADTLTSVSGRSFLFLTEWFDKVGVYKYDIHKKKYKPAWWHPRENVVMLIYESEGHPTFFLTSEKMGTRANFPFFNRLKLFILSADLSETKQIDDLGSGLQFTARWNDDGNLELIYTSVDKTIASYVNQYTRIYDHYGKLVDSEIKTFDIQKSGFPQLVPSRNSTISPSGNYGVSFRGDSVFLKKAGIDSTEFITTLSHSLNKLKWSEDENYLFISTLDLNDETIKSKSPETSELFVFSLSADSVIASFKGSGVKNFFAMNDLLIFDDGFNNNSEIKIYNLNRQMIEDIIKPIKGCGLVFIPQL